MYNPMFFDQARPLDKVEAREVATNGALSDRRDSFERSKKSSRDNNRGQKNKYRFSPYRGPNYGLLSSLSKSPKEILSTKKAGRRFEPPSKMFGSKRARDMFKYCHFHEDYGYTTNDCRHLRTQIQEAVNSGQLSHLVKEIKRKEQSHPTPHEEKVKRIKASHPLKHPHLCSKGEFPVGNSYPRTATNGPRRTHGNNAPHREASNLKPTGMGG
uniref:Reverse transcriptase domain-containing protein n=1 Tax=Tanacetum cinerariifolium TaxID=118510 RepID=A0A6L2MTL2_TANCI|nr:hypothetical protein [Tanacetum cinerariifolium]